jgi:hypothetical protein
MDNIQIAAIQMRAKVGAVASNLSHAESLVREAFRRGADAKQVENSSGRSLIFIRPPGMLRPWLASRCCSPQSSG